MGQIIRKAVKSLSKSGDTPLKDDVTLSEGTGITLTQSGQDIEIASTGGGSGDVTAASSFGTDNSVIRSDGTSKGVQSSKVFISDSAGLTVGNGSPDDATLTMVGSGGGSGTFTVSSVSGNISLNKSFSATGNLSATGTVSGSNLSGTNTGDQTTITGNAGTATALETSRTFRTNLASTSTASFNGTANVTPGVTGNLPVTNGGTGRATSTTAYGLIAAGTTATGAHQTISPGTSGQFLKSAGASALASFATLSSSDLSDVSSLATLTGSQTLTNKNISSSTNTFPAMSAAGSFAVPGSTGNYSVTGLSFQPTTVEFTFLPTVASSSVMSGSGAMSSSSQFTTAIYSNGTDVFRYSSTSNCIARLTNSTTPAILASYVSMNSDGFTVNFTTVDGGPYSIGWRATR